MPKETYWDMLGPHPPEFWEGVKAGVVAYAVWKDGEQFVGVTRRPLKEVLAEIQEQIDGQRKKEEAE